MNEHTKTPWSVDKRAKTLVNGATGHSVATTGGYSNNTMDPDKLHGMLEANARHIVHCVNNHERLVEALRECVSNPYSVSRKARAVLAELQANQQENTDD